MEYSLSAAAKVTGKAKSTLHRAIKSGKISARRADGGSYRIDAAELARVFRLERRGTSRWDDPEPAAEPPRDERAILAVKVAMLEAQLERERETVDDLRRRLDRAEDRIQLLTHQAAEPAPRPGLLRRLFG
jgi:excisionase family DNA binding protein